MPERRVVQQVLTTVVRDGQDAAPSAALHCLVGLHRQLEPERVGLGHQDTHPGHAEHHGRRRAALTTVDPSVAEAALPARHRTTLRSEEPVMGVS